MAVDREVQDLAKAFVNGELSAAELHTRLSTRREAINSDLEADLWALTFEVADGDLPLDEARNWLANKHADLLLNQASAL